MNSFSTIIGNTRLLDYMKKSIENNTTSHAYIFLSEDKILRRQMADTFAKALVCENFDKNGDVCEDCKGCKTFESSNNPNIINIDKGEDKFINVVKIRDNIINDVMYAPSYGKYKIYIIEDADLMNENAQNAILKTLEEPKEYVKIFLLVSKENAMLPTILSRCITLKVMPLVDADVKKWALYNFSNNTDVLSMIDYYAKYASGNVTNLVKITSNENFINIRKTAIDISSKLLSKNFDNFIYCKKVLNNEKENIDEILNILEIWYRDMIFARNNMLDKIINYDMKEEIRAESRQLKEYKLDNAIKCIKKLKEDISCFANYKIALEVFQINVSEV